MKRLTRTRPKSQEQFMAYFRGVPASKLWKALNKLTPGIDWSRCPKEHLAWCWVTQHVHGDIGQFSLRQIREQIPK